MGKNATVAQVDPEGRSGICEITPSGSGYAAKKIDIDRPA
jgi:hypothetical protein